MPAATRIRASPVHLKNVAEVDPDGAGVDAEAQRDRGGDAEAEAEQRACRTSGRARPAA